MPSNPFIEIIPQPSKRNPRLNKVARGRFPVLHPDFFHGRNRKWKFLQRCFFPVFVPLLCSLLSQISLRSCGTSTSLEGDFPEFLESQSGTENKLSNFVGLERLLALQGFQNLCEIIVGKPFNTFLKDFNFG